VSEPKTCDFVFTHEILVILEAADWRDQLIEKAEELALFKPSSMVAPHGGQISYGERRNNDSVVIDRRTHPDLAPFRDKLHAIFAQASELYCRLNPYVSIKRDTGFQLLRYKRGQHFRTHIDNIAGHPTWGQRQLSGVIYLNDDYQGGALCFPRQKKKIKPRAGSVVLFPSNFAYPHESQDVLEGVKYAAVTWFV
jgi:hypothetical protein